MSKKTLSTFDQNDYQQMLRQAVEEIRAARALIAQQVNRTTNSVYWNLGKLLFEKQLSGGYGSGVVKQLSVDLKNEFPNMGVSPRNLWNMKRFYERYYQAEAKLLQAVAVLPWGHNLLLLDKVKAIDAVKFYTNETISKGWSRELLLNAIKMDSYSRAKGQLKTHNFEHTLPKAHAEYANEVFKSTYNLGFLGITESSIGIILCADKDHLDVELALQDIHKPIGVAEYQLLLPKEALQTLILNEINATEQEDE